MGIGVEVEFATVAIDENIDLSLGSCWVDARSAGCDDAFHGRRCDRGLGWIRF